MTNDTERVGDRVVWVTVGLTGIYIAIHLPMLYRSVIEWSRLVSALFAQ